MADNEANSQEKESTTSKTETQAKKRIQKPKKKKAEQPGFRAPRPFPSQSLEVALKIPQTIKDKNGGNPWPPADVAKALGVSPKNTNLYSITASARDYGLTSGTRDSKEIELQEIGREVVYAVSRESEIKALWKAFFNVPVFQSVYDYYKGGALPELQYLQNTLQTKFNLDSKYHTEFAEVYATNLAFLKGLGSSPKSGDSGTVGRTNEPSSLSVVVGEPKNQTSFTAFVAMPFVEKTEKYPKGFFDEVLRNLITPAAVEAGFRVQTARREGSDVIQSTIVNDLLNADMVIADLTEHNPNVLFELGLRMAIEKPIVLIKAKGTPPIFDVDNSLRVQDYDPNLWKTTLEIDVPKLINHIRGGWESREKFQTYMQIFKKSEAA